MISRKLEFKSIANLFNYSKIGVITSFAAKVAGAVFNFIFSIILARLLGVADMGVYFLALTFVGIGGTLARLGLDNASLRFASVAYNKSDQPALAAMYRQSAGLIFAAGSIIAVVIWLAAPIFLSGNDKFLELRAVLPAMLIAIIPAALIRLQGDYFKAIVLPGTGTFIQAALLPMMLCVGVGLLWRMGSTTLQSIVYLYVSASIASVLLAAVTWNWRMPALWKMWGKFDMRLLLRIGLPLILVSSMNLVMSWTSTLVLGAWADSSAVGIYGVAVRITGLTVFILEAVNAVVAPKFSTSYAKGSHHELENIAQRSAYWMLILVSPLAFILLVYPEMILRVFGADFVEGGLVVRILALGQLVNVALGSVGLLLIMTGHEKNYRNAVALSACLNLVGNLALVPFIGALGAAVSTAAALILVKIVSFYYVYKKLNINTIGYMFKKT